MTFVHVQNHLKCIQNTCNSIALFNLNKFHRLGRFDDMLVENNNMRLLMLNFLESIFRQYKNHNIYTQKDLSPKRSRSPGFWNPVKITKKR